MEYEYVESTGSTNTDLILSASDREDFSVLVAGFQTAGRGRSGRDWLAPAGSSLFVSVLLKPTSFDATKFSWLPLMAGLAMQKAVNHFIEGSEAKIKWPNDVLVNDKKISGVLTELVPDLSGVVVGAGLNILQGREELPIEAATSLNLEGAHSPTVDDVLQVYLDNFKILYSAYKQVRGDAVASGLRAAVVENCASIGHRVRVILPGDQELLGEAVGLDDTGRLVFLPDNSGQVMPIAAGDIVHLRHN
ncbi:MAG: hypothetical protein RJB56_524 [Actinomycetota bacterium]|jgi:BirA family transcriptional regulator, biotin operon repressor / biotin---[acetyl-CoA-carboxylase] ligase